MSDVLSWDTSAANNNSSPPDGFPEGQAPSTVNNAARELMAAVKRYADDVGGVTTSGGTSNAYTLAAAQTISAYAAGQWFAFVANHANTGAATLNVDAVGAKSIKKHHDQDLVSGDIKANQVVVVYYQATDDIFEMVSGVPDESLTAYDVNVYNPPNATDSGTDAYQADLGGDVATGDEFVVAFGSANSTTTPTLENTGGAPSGAQNIVTAVAGAKYVGMIVNRHYRVRYNGTNFILMDPPAGAIRRTADSFVKYEDGTQYAWGTVQLTFNANANVTASWTFPRAFASAPKVFGIITGESATPGPSQMTGPRRVSITTTAASFAVDRIEGMTNFQSGDTVDLDVFAIGEG